MTTLSFDLRYQKITTPFKWLLVVVGSCLFISMASGQETGVLQWANHIGGTKSEVFSDITRDPSGNIISGGDFREATVDFDPGPGTFNISGPNGGAYVLKLDADGKFVWAKSFQGALGAGLANINALSTDASGNVYIVGEFYGTVDFDPGQAVLNLVSAGTDDLFIAKLSPDGNLIFAKALPGPGAYVQAKDLVVDGSSNFYITGTSLGTTDFDPGPGEALVAYVKDFINTFVAKYNSNGELVWVKSIKYPVPPLTQGGAGGDAMALDGAGNIYVGGAFQGTADFDPGAGTFNMTAINGSFYKDDAYIMKLDNGGNFIWAKSYTTTDVGSEYVTAMQTDGTHLYVTGNYGGNPTDFDPGPGQTLLSGSNIYFSKFDLDGSFVWARTLGGYYSMLPWLSLDAGNVYLTFSFHSIFTGPLDFDPGPGVHMLSADSWDVAISKFKKNGDFVWAVSVGSPDAFDTFARNLADPSGNVYISGGFSNTSDFDPSLCGVYNVTSFGETDVFNLKVSSQLSAAAPTITSFTPGIGPVGSTVEIKGTNFSTSLAANTVKFNNNKTAVVTAATTTSLTVTVPSGTTTGKITVMVNCQAATSDADFVIGAAPQPTISSFTPSSAEEGATVTISGTNFSATAANNIVKFNGTAATVATSTTTSITTTVPDGATTGKITVTVGANTATSIADFTVTTIVTDIESNDNGVNVFPNPCSSALFIEIPGERDMNVALVDAFGRTQRQQQSAALMEFDVRDLASGTYVLIVQTKNRRQFFRILKQR